MVVSSSKGTVEMCMVPPGKNRIRSPGEWTNVPMTRNLPESSSAKAAQLQEPGGRPCSIASRRGMTNG